MTIISSTTTTTPIVEAAVTVAPTPETAQVLASKGNVALVIQDGSEPLDAVAAALDDAGASAATDVTVVEIPPAAGSDSDTSLFVVLWGRATRSLTWVDQLVEPLSDDPDQLPSPATTLAPGMMASVLTAGNMAFGVSDTSETDPYRSLARWLAVASPTRAAWDALDRFFLAKHEQS